MNRIWPNFYCIVFKFLFFHRREDSVIVKPMWMVVNVRNVKQGTTTCRLSTLKVVITVTVTLLEQSTPTSHATLPLGTASVKLMLEVRP